MIETVNPTTGEPIERYDEHDGAAIEQRLDAAWTRFTDWRERAIDDRLEVLDHAAKLLDERTEQLATLMTTEMGKPISAARAEVSKCAWLCRHYVEHAADYLAPEPHDVGAERAYVRFDPLGPILAVMPWNFPLWQVFRFAVPNLAAGNVGLLKHSANTTGCALAIEHLLLEAGAPHGAFAALLVGHDAVADVIADERVRGATLTGSDRAGRAIAGTAGTHLKKTVLELGGSDPLLVLADADLDAAAATAVQSRFLNNGQSCINAKRLVVVDEVYEPFLSRFTQRTAALVVGDPLDEDTDIGPLARSDLRDGVDDQVRRTLDGFATVELEGGPLDRPGSFYAPVVLRDVDVAAPVAREEVFGPVAPVMHAADVDDAVRIANASRFGLGAAVWTADLDLAERLASRLDAGMVFVNELVKSDPRLPFGGVKDSGYGRELGREGAREFTSIKTVWVSSPGDVDRDAVE